MYESSSLENHLQLDEAADVSNCSQLIALVRYADDGTLKENFLFCEGLKKNTKVKDVLQFVKDLFCNK